MLKVNFNIKLFFIQNDKNEKSIENKNCDTIRKVNERNNLKRKNKKGSLFARKIEVLKNRYKKPTLLQKVFLIFKLINN